MAARDRNSPTDAGRRALLPGLAAAWICLLVTWPAGVSFQDEIGYGGGARLLLEGRVRPSEETVTIWIPTGSGPVSKYPLFPSLPLIPFYLFAPLAAPAVAAISLALLAWLASQVLSSWGVSRAWALVLAAHPTFVLLARTLMPDIPLALIAVAAWWTLRRERWAATLPLFALLVLIKPTGIVLAVPILVGEALRRRARGGQPSTPARLLMPATGIVIGIAAVGALNLLQNGTLGYGYALTSAGTVFFSPAHLYGSGGAILLSLLLLPPGLVLGILPWWKRREWGVVLPVAALVGAMAVYFHVDRGRGGLDALVLAPRLVLPAAAFLLIGYGDLLAALARRARAERWVAAALVAMAPLAWLGVGLAHQRWQQPMAEARKAAETRLAAEGGTTLGLSYGAFKAGMPSSRPVRWVPRTTEPVVALCSTEVPTYHTDATPTMPCELPGYRVVERIGPYAVLVRD